MSHHWVCRPYQAGDEAGIIELYRDVFNTAVSPELWRWMYQSCPAGPAAICVVESGGRMVGHYGVQPRGFWFNQQRCTAGLAVGAMLLPEARNVATLAEMVKLAGEICRQRGMPWLYAFPNDPSHRVHCALLGWRALPAVVEWDGPLPSSTGASGDVQVSRQMPPELEFDTIDSGSQKRAISSLRSTDWLRWRFFDRPGGEYVLHSIAQDRRVIAYTVTKRYQRDAVLYGHLLDWRMLPEATHRARELLASVWRQLADWKVQRVSAWARGRDDLGGWLADAGLSLTGRKSNFCFLDLAGAHQAQLEQESVWQVEMADNDIY